eukprot:360564-Chlamydomonas_euryale.AAC.2
MVPTPNDCIAAGSAPMPRAATSGASAAAHASYIGSCGDDTSVHPQRSAGSGDASAHVVQRGSSWPVSPTSAGCSAYARWHASRQLQHSGEPSAATCGMYKLLGAAPPLPLPPPPQPSPLGGDGGCSAAACAACSASLRQKSNSSDTSGRAVDGGMRAPSADSQPATFDMSRRPPRSRQKLGCALSPPPGGTTLLPSPPPGCLPLPPPGCAPSAPHGCSPPPPLGCTPSVASAAAVGTPELPGGGRGADATAAPSAGRPVPLATGTQLPCKAASASADAERSAAASPAPTCADSTAAPPAFTCADSATVAAAAEPGVRAGSASCSGAASSLCPCVAPPPTVAAGRPCGGSVRASPSAATVNALAAPPPAPRASAPATSTGAHATPPPAPTAQLGVAPPSLLPPGRVCTSAASQASSGAASVAPPPSSCFMPAAAMATAARSGVILASLLGVPSHGCV